MANNNTRSSTSRADSQDVHQSKDLGKAEFKRHLRGLEPDEFERFVADVWELLKDGSTTITKTSGDMGVDVQVTTGSEKEVIQVKRYGSGNPVRRPEVQRYYTLYDQEHADRVTIVTTEGFTEEAKAWAANYGITLYTSDDLYALIRDAGLSSLLEDRYLAGKYSLIDRETGFLKRIWDALTFTVKNLIIAVMGFVRLICATILFSISGWIIVGVATIVTTGVFFPGSEGVVTNVFSSSMGVETTAALFGGSLFMYPISLYFCGRNKRSILALGIFVGIFFVSSSDSILGDSAHEAVLNLYFILILLFSSADLYTLYKKNRILWQLAEHFVSIVSNLVPSSNENTSICMENYATITAKR